MSEKISLPLSIILAGLLIAGGIYLNGKIAKENPTVTQKQEASSQNLSEAMRPIDANDHILGNSDARVVIVEYSDTECPYCKVFHSVMLSIMNEYGSSGKVAWIYRYFPIKELHAKSFNEAVAQECAASLGGNSKFWEFTNKLYEVTNSNDSLNESELPKIASSIGLSSEKFSTCLNSGEFDPRVNQDIQNAQEMDSSGTPYSIIIDTKKNEYYPMDGAYPYSSIKSVVDMIISS